MKALSRWRRVVGWLATDRWLLVSALALLSAARVGLCVLPVRTVARYLGRLVPGRPERIADPALAGRVARAVARASRVVPGATCLPQALAARVLLERHGLPTRVHIGMVRDGGQVLRGHAWVESQGLVVVGGGIPGPWSPLLSLEGARVGPGREGRSP